MRHFRLCGAMRFQGGATWLSKQEIARQYVEKHKRDESKFIELAELMKLDIGEDVSADEMPSRIEEWAKLDIVQKRGVYAPQLINSSFEPVKVCLL